MRVIAIANNKGGCGKTASTHYLGRLLAEQGIGTLLIDLDPQANLTESFTFVNQATTTIADVLGGAMPGVNIIDAVEMAQATDPLWLCPSEFQLANVAFGLLNDAVRGRTALRRALLFVPEHVDICLIDCPPEAGILLVNALLAADGVICPAEPEPAALDGVKRVTEMVDLIRSEYERDKPMMLGTVATRIDNRTNRHQDGVERMRQSAVPLLGCIPERNGGNRERDLLDAYRPVAEWIAEWIGGERNVRPTEDE